MNEGFDINKKINSKEYRKNLADELRVIIKELGFDEARGRLTEETSKGEEGVYFKAKEEKLAQWVIQKYLSEPELFEEEDFNKADEQEIKDRLVTRFAGKKVGGSEKANDILERGGGVGIGSRIKSNLIDKKYENDTTFLKFKGPHSDIILSSDPKIRSKFIAMIILAEEATEENMLKAAYYILKNEEDFEKRNEKDSDYKSRCTRALNSVFEGQYCFIKKIYSQAIIARPYDVRNNSFIQKQHSHIADNFTKDRDMGYSKRLTYQGQERKLSTQKELYINKAKEIIEDICNQDLSFEEAIKKMQKLPSPIESPEHFHAYVRDGGYMNSVLDNTGSIVGVKLSGVSEYFGYDEELREEIIKSLNKDFPEKKFV